MAEGLPKNVELEAEDPSKAKSLNVEGGKAEGGKVYLTVVQQQIGEEIKKQINGILETVNAFTSNEKNMQQTVTTLHSLIEQLPFQLSQSLAEQHFNFGKQNQILSDELNQVTKDRDEKSKLLAEEIKLTKRLKEQQEAVELQDEGYQKQKRRAKDLRNLRDDTMERESVAKVSVQASHDARIKELKKDLEFLEVNDEINMAEIDILKKQVRDLTADLQQMARQDAGFQPRLPTKQEVEERKTLESTLNHDKTELKTFNEEKEESEKTLRNAKIEMLREAAQRWLDTSEQKGKELVAKAMESDLALQRFDASHKTGPARSNSVFSRTLSFSTDSSELTCVECEAPVRDLFKYTDCLDCKKPLQLRLSQSSSGESVAPDRLGVTDATGYNVVSPAR